MVATTILNADFIESRVERIPFSGCWIWTRSSHARGYGNVTFQGRHEKAHRLSWRVYRGDVHGMNVLHRCDVPACVNPDHLFLGTQKDNAADMVSKGRHRMPTPDQKFKKLSDESVREILAAKETRIPRDQTPHILAEKFGVKVRQIYKIWEGVQRRAAWQ